MTDNLRFALQGGWQVLWVSLLFGAGLPLLFAVGVRSLAWGSDGGAHVATAPGAGQARGPPSSASCSPGSASSS